MSTDFFFGRKTGGGKEGFFKRIKPVKANGLEIFRQIVFKKPVIQKSGLLFIGQVGLDDLGKKIRIFSIKKKVNFVTGIFPIIFQFLLAIEFGPVE